MIFWFFKTSPQRGSKKGLAHCLDGVVCFCGGGGFFVWFGFVFACCFDCVCLFVFVLTYIKKSWEEKKVSNLEICPEKQVKLPAQSSWAHCSGNLRSTNNEYSEWEVYLKNYLKNTPRISPLWNYQTASPSDVQGLRHSHSRFRAFLPSNH